MTWRIWLRQWFCGLWGHNPLLELEEARAFIRCASCGWESTGIQLSNDVRAYRRRLVS